MHKVFLALIGLCLFQAVAVADSAAVVEYPRCEYKVNPLGTDAVEPRLSWEMSDARRGAKQTAYQVLVASTPEKLAADEGDLWDSGKVASDQSTQIAYAGKPLQSRMQCHWKVRLWDAAGEPTAYGKPALWTMGLLKPEDFKAKWIAVTGSSGLPGHTNAARAADVRRLCVVLGRRPRRQGRRKKPRPENVTSAAP